MARYYVIATAVLPGAHISALHDCQMTMDLANFPKITSKIKINAKPFCQFQTIVLDGQTTAWPHESIQTKFQTYLYMDGLYGVEI